MDTRPSVLVVDDDLPILQMIDVVLSRAAMRVEAVASGSAAIEQIAAKEYAAIVLDLTMPNVSGFEVIAHLKKENAALLPRVVIITAMTDTGIRRLDRSLVHSVMSKPFDINALVKTVRECIAGESPSAVSTGQDVGAVVAPAVSAAAVVQAASDRVEVKVAAAPVAPVAAVASDSGPDSVARERSY